jgi:PTH1 family peptidyl-tRNA hydrolase
MFRKKARVDLPPQWLVVGLGNPGGEYRGTRHNIGFEVIEELARQSAVKLGTARHRALTAIVNLNDTPVALAKPMTFMNLSGQAVAPLLKHFGLGSDRLVIVADDLDLPLGKLRLRFEGSAGGHNGHKSIIGALKTEEYARLKIGIGKVDRTDTIDHVLGGFTPDERVAVDSAVRASGETIAALVSQGKDQALRVLERFNI